MKKVVIVLAALVVVGLLVGITLGGVHYELVTQRGAIDAAWAQVNVALDRRADLIPSLVEAVRGIAAQERSVLDSVTSARAALIGAGSREGRIDANARLDTALARLLLEVDSDPALKSNENLRRLHDELAGAEEGIARERRKYNELVQRYNTSIALFPSNLVAGLFHFQRNDAYFRTEPAASAAPKASVGEPR